MPDQASLILVQQIVLAFARDNGEGLVGLVLESQLIDIIAMETGGIDDIVGFIAAFEPS
jgi:hypothetical protein